MPASVPLPELWLPILLSAVAVFVLSAMAWMVMPHHNRDFKGLPDEDGFFDSLRTLGVKPGLYMFPFCASSAEMKTDAFKQRYERGPHGMLNLWAGRPNMGRNLALTFVFYVVLSLFVAYIAHLGLDAADARVRVFRVTSAAALLGYAFGAFPNAIWFGRPLRSVVTDLIDSVVYALVTGAIFTWLWPAVEAA